MDRRDPWGHRLSLWVFALLLFLAPLAAISLTELRLDNSIENWLPRHDEQAQVFHWCHDQFPEREQVVVSWEGSTLDDPRLPLLAAHLLGRLDPDGVRRDGSPYVQAIVDAHQLITRITSYNVPLDEALHRVEGTLVGRGWIKVQLTPAGGLEKDRTIREILAQAREELHLDLVVHEPAACWQPSPLMEEPFNQRLAQWLPEESASVPGTGAESPQGQEPASAVPPAAVEFVEHDFQLGWSGMSNGGSKIDQVIDWLKNFRGFETTTEPAGRLLVQSASMEAGSPVAMIVQLSEAGIANKPAALDAIRSAATDCFIASESLMLGGRAVAGAALNKAVVHSAWNPTSPSLYSRSVIGLSGLVGIAFALISLRSLRLGALVVGVAYYTAILGTAIVPVTGGSMNLVLVVMPTLLMVVTLSGAIHVANYWKHAAWESPKHAVSRAISMAWQPCLMSGVTTALGLFSLATSSLLPVRQFGIYSGLGTLLSLVLVLYGLPALLEIVPLRRIRPDEVNSSWWRTYGEFLCRRPGRIQGTFIVTSLICCGGLAWFRTETKVIRYFPDDSQLVQDYRRIEDTLAGISPVEIIVRFSREAQADYRFLERMEVVRAIEDKLREHAEVSGVLGLPDFQPVHVPPGADAKTRDKVFFNRRSNEVERRVKDQMSDGAREFLAVTDRPFSIGARALSAEGDELWRLSIQASVLTDSDYGQLTSELDELVRSVARYYPGADHVVTGTVPLFLRTQQAVLEGLISSTIGAFAMILLLMIVVLKDPIAGLLSMLPNVLPLAVVFGVVSFLGERIDVGSMVTASIALGIAVDNTLHLTTWYVGGLEKGLSREKAISAALSHCGPAMFQTSAAISIAMLVLIPADLLLISRFGWLMAALIMAAVLGAVVLLPAMLMGTLGSIIQQRVFLEQAKRQEQATHHEQPVGHLRDGISPESVIPSPHIPLQPGAHESLRLDRGRVLD